MKRIPLALLMGLAVCLSGCGYRRVGSAAALPGNVRTIAVPMFVSNVQAFRTEVAFTEGVVRELNTRTSYRVLTAKSPDADATLRGAILSETVAPLTYDATTGQTASYLVTVTASVQLVAHDGTVLYRNDAFGWREQYQSTQDLSGFVQEDGAAVRRMAHDFGQALVSELLEGIR